MAQHMAPCTIPPLSVWPCGTPFGERERVTRRQTSSKRRDKERDIHRDNERGIHRGRERHIHRRASQGGRAGARCERERGREGDMHRGERERVCERDIHRGGV